VPDDPVLVTGGSGFIGGELVRRLVAVGQPVHALARSDEAAAVVAGLGAVPVRGDLLEPESLFTATRGRDVVFHAAGTTAFCVRDTGPMFRVNVDGTRNLIEAAARAGARRVVYTSSGATLGEAAGTVGHEQTVHRGWFLSAYERSKFEAEQAAFEAAQATGIELVCVNPASVQGPGRTHGTANLLLDLVTGRLPFVVESRLSVVDIADCTTGHLLAADRGVAGERYVLCGVALTASEAIALLAEAAGAEFTVRFIRPQLARAGASAAERVAHLVGRPPRVCSELVRTLIHGHVYDGSRAARELGLSYTPIRESLKQALR
jgi:dihydroflavonol-4-reductase